MNGEQISYYNLIIDLVLFGLVMWVIWLEKRIKDLEYAAKQREEKESLLKTLGELPSVGSK